MRRLSLRHGMRLLPLFLAFFACTTETSPAPPPAARARYRGATTAVLEGAQARVELHLDAFSFRVLDKSGKVLLDTLASDSAIAGDDAHGYGALGATHHETVFNSSIVEGWDHVVGTDSPWKHATAVAAATFDGAHASVDLFDPADESTTLHLDVTLDGALVRIDASIASSATPIAAGDEVAGALNQMGVSFALPSDEHFYALGERYVTTDHRGQSYMCWVEEGGIGAGEHAQPGPQNPSPNGPTMTHAPIPFFISSRGYGLWIETGYRTGFHFGSDSNDAWRLYSEEPNLHLRVMVHDDPKDTLAHFTALTGRASLPAPWVFGPRRRVDRNEIEAGMPVEQALREKGVPTTMLDDTLHFLPVNDAVGRTADLASWTTRIRALGYKAIGYFNAYVSTSDPNAKPLVDYGRAHDFFVRSEDGTEFDTFMISSGGQTVATIDMTNPDAVAWFQSLEQGALDLGYDGWMLDFGEYLPQHAKMWDGTSGWEGHNLFPVLYQKAAYDLLKRVRGNDFMFYARAGYTGSQATIPVLWSGDPSASFDPVKGLPANVRAGINAGLTGIPFWGSDISGYTCAVDPPADKEVYLRWSEFGAFSSDMHDEPACAQAPPGSPPKWTLWSDDETVQVYGRYALLHTRLFPYLYATGLEATQTGMPVIRHPLLMVPKEPDAWSVDDAYFFGPSLYVAPVVTRGATSRTVYLPKGTWVDWWTMAPIVGGASVTRNAPLDTLPLWQRAGSIIAMLDPSVQTLAPDEGNPTVVSMDDVAGILDVRAVVSSDATSASEVLVDGTDLGVVFDAGTTVALPAGVPTVDEASLATCTSTCGRIDALANGAERIRITTAPTTDSTLLAGNLVLRASRPPVATQFRWDVVVSK